MMWLVPRRLVVASSVAFLVVTLLNTFVYAQTDYFWNNTGLASTSGGAGTWDTSTLNWSTTTAQPTPAVNQNNYNWQNLGTERANFGNVGAAGTAGTVTLGSN